MTGKEKIIKSQFFKNEVVKRKMEIMKDVNNV